MKKLYLTILTLCLLAIQPAMAVTGIGLKFSRSGTDAASVTVSVVDENGTVIEGATATVTSSHSFKGTGAAVTDAIICPNVNGNTNPTIELAFALKGLPTGFEFNTIGLDIHALNGGGNYQEPGDGITRKWNVAAKTGGAAFGSLNDIDIAAGVGATGAVHKVWDITSNSAVTSDGTLEISLTITAGSENKGCFFGLSEVLLGETAVEPDPEPEPEPEEGDAKVYYIQWKNTGKNYITEESDHRMAVRDNDVTKAQFWKFIPTGKENCYYIKNTATDRYMGSCNLTPSSASKISTSETPVEYYVKKTSATSGEIAGCYYFSSTDCENYSSENAGPRALNKDGASDYVITWQAGTSRVGSYWKLIETEDLYEVRPFDGCEGVGKIGTSYNMETVGGKNLTIVEGALALATPDAFDKNQEWYFIGTGNAGGWQIASSAEPSLMVGIADGESVVSNNADTRWKVYASKENRGYYYFACDGTAFTVEGDSLFKFTRVRSAYSRRMQIYNNPCGTAGNNFFTAVKLDGEDVASTIIYEAKAKPGNWHVVYAMDKGEVMSGGSFNVTATLSSAPESNVVAGAYFDWDGDGMFETCHTMDIAGTACSVAVTVPDWATEKQTRMRLRINSNGLDLAEDEVNGFIYDFHIKVVEPQAHRTVTVEVNSWERGKATLSAEAESYEPGTALTATAVPYGNARFVCWRQEGVVVSTSAEYTFTVDHNVKLVAYFTPNTDEDSYPTGVDAVPSAEDITITEEGGKLVATAASAVRSMAIYTIDAATVAQSNGNTIGTGNVKSGIYIVRVTTENGYKNIKRYINGL